MFNYLLYQKKFFDCLVGVYEVQSIHITTDISLILLYIDITCTFLGGYEFVGLLIQQELNLQ
jgi:hypothetical protein